MGVCVPVTCTDKQGKSTQHSRRVDTLLRLPELQATPFLNTHPDAHALHGFELIVTNADRKRVHALPLAQCVQLRKHDGELHSKGGSGNSRG